MAQALVKFMDQQYVELDGVEHKFVHGVFGIFGHGCVTGVGEALEYTKHNLTFYQGKNEQSMGLAAMAYAKQLDRLGIIPCVSSVGPGATNMVTAAACATANRIPLLLLPGDTFACRQPDPVLQQVELFNGIGNTVNDAFRAVCRYFDRINRPEQLMSALIQAFRVLTDPAETGAVCIAMPQDVEAEAYDYPEEFFRKRIWHIDRRPLNESQLVRLEQLIRESRRPLFIAGGGVRYSQAGEILSTLSRTTKIPVAETQAGKGVVDVEHEFNLGGIGVTGTAAANRVAEQADLIIGVGTRFSDFTTASKWLFKNPDCRFVSINICGFDTVKLESEPILADAKEALTALARVLGDYCPSYGRDEISSIKQEWQMECERVCHPKTEEFNQMAAVSYINEYASDHDVVCCAAGSLPGDLQRFWRPGDCHSYHVEYGFSNMGYDLNGALGVKLAQPESRVFAMVGDGGYLMLNAEVHTMVQERLRIDIMLFDNSGWGCIENLQNSQGGNSYGTQFRMRHKNEECHEGQRMKVDFALNARSLGCAAYTCHSLEELKAALKDSESITDRPVLFDLKVAPGTMSNGYAWWRVGVAEVSNGSKVNAAYKAMAENIKQARKY